MFKFGTRSESNLKGVNPQLVAVARRALQLTKKDFTVIEGLRTVERQRQLVAAGKSQTMKSNHITGRAIDIIPVGISDPSSPGGAAWLPGEFDEVLDAFYAAGKELGVKLRFGRNWNADPNAKYGGRFIDSPHVELAE